MATPGMDVEVVTASDVETASVQENCSDVINPPKNFDLFRQNGYIIDWCQYQVTNKQTNKQYVVLMFCFPYHCRCS